ncbi:VirD4-like conjugal transfer protein, CD1115 family [Staphylococcus haemolyticus]|uniref:VirD4-like conjugal transfer protein, CD1115 family n=1 Tax=Staphylococcus haemolyticus TaxID=1283 RepID=UPI001F0A725C|nr:type IV secretory system conjugative DNA transfer family protein [Staphylococcus haemolyticus]MCH4334951.1 type IV secretory system conjugative DNA transfer family protein [Staphylococcus haemolyticus]
MNSSFLSNKKLNKMWYIGFTISVIISLFLTHLVNILLAVILNKSVSKTLDLSKFKEHLFDFIYVTNLMLDKYSLLTIFVIFVAILFGVCYLLQGLIFDEKGYSEADDVGIHGTSKWGNPETLRDGKVLAKHKESKYKNNDLSHNLNMENGIILGKVPNKKELMIMHDNTSIDNQNVVVIGSSGAGKSQAYVIPNLINIRNKSIIVTDPKGELYELTSQLKRDQGYKTYQVDFVNFKQAKYNPLYYVETPLDAQKIANTIISNFEKGGENGSGQFFKNSATNILSALIVYVKTEYDKDEANLEKVVEVYDEHIQDEEHFLKWVDTIPKEHPAKDLLNSIKELTDVTRKSVTSTLSNGFSLFKLPQVKSMTSKSDFNFEDFIEEKAILYVKLSMEDDTFAPLTSVFFSQMLNIYYQIAQESSDNKLKRKMIFMLDEFANIGKLDNYSKVLATCRSLGLSMHTIIQNKAQLEKRSMYGKDEATDILGNHDTTVLLRADKKDTNTTKWISDTLGDTTIAQKKNDMTKSKGGISKQLGDNFIKRPLMTPAEIGSLTKKECIVLISGHDPLFLDKAFQAEVYPNLITTKVEENGETKFKYNYDNKRTELGYNTPVEHKEDYDVKKQQTFSEIREERKKEQISKDDSPTDKKEDKDKVSNNGGQAKTPNEEIKEKLSQDNQREKIDDIAENMTAESYEQLNNLNEISKQNEQVNGTAYANLKEETKDSVVAKATETVGGFGGALESMEEENDNQQKGEHTI